MFLPAFILSVYEQNNIVFFWMNFWENVESRTRNRNILGMFYIPILGVVTICGEISLLAKVRALQVPF